MKGPIASYEVKGKPAGILLKSLGAFPLPNIQLSHNPWNSFYLVMAYRGKIHAARLNEPFLHELLGFEFRSGREEFCV
jgi:hypothetical protein